MGSSSCLRKLDICWLEDVERAMSIAHSTSSPFLYSTGYQSVCSLTEAMAMLVLTGDTCRDMQFFHSEHFTSDFTNNSPTTDSKSDSKLTNFRTNHPFYSPRHAAYLATNARRHPKLPLSSCGLTVPKSLSDQHPPQREF